MLLTTAYVDPAQRGGGVGRMLVRAMARDLVERGIRAVEAFGDRAAGRRAAARCRPTSSAGVGFRTQRAHPTTPRMRMDLRTARQLEDEVEAALERLVGVVRPRHETAARPGGRAAVARCPDGVLRDGLR